MNGKQNIFPTTQIFPETNPTFFSYKCHPINVSQHVSTARQLDHKRASYHTVKNNTRTPNKVSHSYSLLYSRKGKHNSEMLHSTLLVTAQPSRAISESQITQ
ncbi:hypothetical protein CDAR_116741 [Caerostris darwini]|uniref:Uncharacterized protein n=1 Tax=Caerostris darwini TaxID=1538125 RepID=A0AAV4W8A7_9ARAC|nr:hypothetical protein CDAR_116741 [Caerostris darwini]